MACPGLGTSKRDVGLVVYIQSQLGDHVRDGSRLTESTFEGWSRVLVFDASFRRVVVA